MRLRIGKAILQLSYTESRIGFCQATKTSASGEDVDVFFCMSRQYLRRDMHIFLDFFRKLANISHWLYYLCIRVTPQLALREETDNGCNHREI